MSEEWEDTTLSEVAQVNPRDPALSEDAPFITMADVDEWGTWANPSGPKGKRGGIRARGGDTLVARITPCLENGKIAMVPHGFESVGGSTEFIVLRASERLEPEFLFLWACLDATHKSAIGLMTGTTGRQRVSAVDYGALPVAVPPLPVQRRIVDLMTHLDTQIANLQAEQDALVVARLNFLRLALNGELVSAPMSKDWNEVEISSLLEVSIGGVWGVDEGEAEADVRTYRSTDFNADGRLSVGAGVRRSIKLSQLASRRLQRGDILLEKSGGGPNQPVGRVVQVEQELDFDAVCANFVQLLRPNPAVVESRYLFLVLWEAHLSNVTLEFQAQTTGIRNLRTKDYLARSIVIPPLELQRRIVTLAMSFEQAISDLGEEITGAMSYRTSLLTSLLDKRIVISNTYDALLDEAS